MHVNVNGLVIAASDVREGDKYLTFLTDGQGKIRVNARGASRRGSRHLAATQLFSYSALTLFENKGRYTLDAAEPARQFFGVGADVWKLSLASYFAELLNAVTDPGADCADMLSLGVAALDALEKDRQSLTLIKATFEMKLMNRAGFAPELSLCPVCGQPLSAAAFHLMAGVLHHPACRGGLGAGVSLPLSSGALDAMRHIAEAEDTRLFSYRLGADSEALLADAAEGYLLSRLERNFKTLAFYKKLSIPMTDNELLRNNHEKTQ